MPALRAATHYTPRQRSRPPPLTRSDPSSRAGWYFFWVMLAVAVMVGGGGFLLFYDSDTHSTISEGFISDLREASNAIEQSVLLINDCPHTRVQELLPSKEGGSHVIENIKFLLHAPMGLEVDEMRGFRMALDSGSLQAGLNGLGRTRELLQSWDHALMTVGKGCHKWSQNAHAVRDNFGQEAGEASWRNLVNYVIPGTMPTENEGLRLQQISDDWARCSIPLSQLVRLVDEQVCERVDRTLKLTTDFIRQMTTLVAVWEKRLEGGSQVEIEILATDWLRILEKYANPTNLSLPQIRDWWDRLL